MTLLDGIYIIVNTIPQNPVLDLGGVTGPLASPIAGVVGLFVLSINKIANRIHQLICPQHKARRREHKPTVDINRASTRCLQPGVRIWRHLVDGSRYALTSCSFLWNICDIHFRQTKLSNSYFQLMAQPLLRSNRLDTTPSITRPLAGRLPNSTTMATASKNIIIGLCNDYSLLMDHLGSRACHSLAKLWILRWLALGMAPASFYTRTTRLPIRSGNLSLLQFR